MCEFKSTSGVLTICVNPVRRKQYIGEISGKIAKRVSPTSPREVEITPAEEKPNPRWKRFDTDSQLTRLSRMALDSNLVEAVDQVA